MSVSGVANRFAELGRPDLIIILGYGPELSAFTRARALWDFYLNHFPNLNYLVCRAAPELQLGDIRHNGHDLLFGSRQREVKVSIPAGPDYASSGVWSHHENHTAISSQVALYDYLRRRYPQPFLVVHCTITCVLDFRGLMSLVDQLPRKGCFAGMPGRINTPGTYENLGFVCGTNSAFSSDVTQLLAQRFDPASPHNAIPQDVNVSWMLKDVPSIPLPFFTFSKPRSPLGSPNNVAAITRRMLDMGHYQFRVKTTSEQAGLGKREDVDPWIMLEVMRTILSHTPPPGAAITMQQKLVRALNTANGQTMAAYEAHFFDGPRDFPLNDEEAEHIFPDLRETL